MSFQNTEKKASIAVVGLGVMGQNLILNIADKGYKVVAYNREKASVDNFLEENKQNSNIIGSHSAKEMVEKLSNPKIVFLMVKAGWVVDSFLDEIVPFLNEGDVVIDGGNSNYLDTQRRSSELSEKGIHFIGAGISGGEEGARYGASIMPGGDQKAWPIVRDILQAISAKTTDGESCCKWIGQGGSGHFVKMVHNGIEYGDMQLISEVYHFMKVALSLENDQMAGVFEDWNENSMLKSYLIEITAKILEFKDSDGQYVLDYILDRAGQKGTGKWTAMESLDVGSPLTLIAESVFARFLSSQKDTRVKAENFYCCVKERRVELSEEIIKDLQQALLFAKIISYAQGFMLMKEASDKNEWKLNYGDIALVWREGCIIRSVFLNDIKSAYSKNPELENLLFDDYFKGVIKETLPSIRSIASLAIKAGIPMPALNSAITFFDGFTTARLPANLLQAQRDYFGAHTYQRVDRGESEFFHTNWNI
ncbi:decarboxylating NADP(+)-dependent phosphogluconate dehydrogenase [Candidatus Francisella endociliophora]|uniref:decarboxylating NADP(+)-dependent phosphogluconate dehydrogenase n=1 Tax=Candidatus Francisella endociliophora TaxID=653937 RepID=UPI000693C13A|nr:decarboxylating NADP(+)-dependent phosphogluconate dehydrogenase [Francisella sp. FSC1006]